MPRYPLTLLLILTLIAFTSPALAAPVITVDRPVFDFGSITQGKKIDHVFILKNRGDMPLTILRTRTSCGCTAANVSTKTVEPGRSTELKTTFDSANFSGKITKTITVETNDPANPTYTLTVKGVVNEELFVTPRQANLGLVRIGGTKEIVLTLENRGEQAVRIASVSSPMPQVKVSAKKNSLRPGESTPISVKVTPRETDRFLSGFISITTDNPGKPEITVPLYGSVGK